MYEDPERQRIRVGFRIDPKMDGDFNELAKQLHMTINEAHVEAVKQFLYTKGTKAIKMNIEIERKKLDALEQYVSQFEETQILPEQIKQTITKELLKDIDKYVLRIDRSFTSHHIVEYASSIANKNNLLLIDVLNLLRESVNGHFPDNSYPNRRLVLIENAINDTEGV